MPVQTQESKRAGMNAFLDIYEEFDGCISHRSWGGATTRVDKIALFGIYISRME